jgi:hypothetical protein
MAPVLKTGIPERVSGVRIPPSPPAFLSTVVESLSRWLTACSRKRGTRNEVCSPATLKGVSGRFRLRRILGYVKDKQPLAVLATIEGGTMAGALGTSAPP